MSELAKEPSQYHLQSQSSHDEDMEKAEEEEGDASDLEEPWDGMVEDDVLPPSLHLVWDGGKIIKCIDPSSGARIWRCHHCNNKWSGWNHTKALAHAIGGEGHQGMQENASRMEEVVYGHCEEEEPGSC